MAAFKEQTFTSRFDPRLWRNLVLRARSHWPTFIVLIGVMLLVGATDAALPLLSGIAVDRFVEAGSLEGLAGFAAVYLGLAVGQGFLVWLLIVLAGRIEMGLMHTFRRDAFVHLQHLSMSYFDRTPVGWIMSRLTSDVQRLGEIIAWGLVDIVWGMATMLAIAVTMVVIEARLALLVLTVVPPLALVSYWFQRRILTAQRRVRKLNSEISAAFNEGINGAPTSKTLVREAENLREFSVLSGNMRTATVRATLYSALYMPVVLLLGSIGTAIAVIAGGLQAQLGVVTIGTVVAFVGYTVQFFEPVREVARVLTELQAAQSAAERLSSLLETQPEIVDRPEIVASYGTVLEPKRTEWPACYGEVAFDRVSFQYGNDGDRVLTDFSLHVPAGQSVALVGQTGAGKTTIVNLVSRFYEPTAGRVLVDGVDIRDRSIGWLHSQLGYVLQAPHLFRGTIMDNIRYGRLDATDDEVVAAARLVAADEVIERLSDGFAHEVGEGGAGLSTGEKQLVSFARAVLADPAIFILDEATSSIDTETEMRIQRAIHVLLEGRTSFVIAHRLSTIRDADRILVLEHGTIIEDGTHEELLRAGGHYENLYREQFAVGV